jgi:hypothetical protein
MRYTFTGQVVRAYITGQLIGPIWQGQTCTKPFSITLTGSITDALEKVRKDGDFQHVEINHAILTVVWADERGYTLERRVRLYRNMKAIKHHFSVPRRRSSRAAFRAT